MHRHHYELLACGVNLTAAVGLKCQLCARESIEDSGLYVGAIDAVAQPQTLILHSPPQPILRAGWGQPPPIITPLTLSSNGSPELSALLPIVQLLVSLEIVESGESLAAFSTFVRPFAAMAQLMILAMKVASKRLSADLNDGVRSQCMSHMQFVHRSLLRCKHDWLSRV
jgi:hypothetical protein